MSTTFGENLFEESNELMLSVFMITWNHEKYISKAIESILMQKTSFRFEIVIGEDCSSDGTRAIILEFARKYPQQFNLILHDKTIGMMRNFFSTMRECKGKYIAICEGDDYWTDCMKLQKQVDFLEQNPDFAICCHNVVAEEENGTSSDLWVWDEIKHFGLSDLAHGNFISTPSVVFRKNEFSLLHEKYLEAPFGDFILHLFNARAGDICYMPEKMAVYRIHSEGVWTSRKSTLEKEIVLYNKFLLTNRMLLADFAEFDECRESFNKGITESLNQLRILYGKKGQYGLSKKFAGNLIYHMFSIRKINRHTLLSCMNNVFCFRSFKRKLNNSDETGS